MATNNAGRLARRGAWLAALTLVVCGAGKKKTQQVLDEIRAEEREVAPPPPASTWGCPPGAKELGAPPPLGTEAWCASLAPNGVLVRQGPSWTWSHDGKLIASGTWSDDKRTGPWFFWRAHDGSLERHGSFVAGVEQGWWTYWDEKGQIASEGDVVDGERSGWWWARDPSTGLLSQGQYQRGVRTGVWVELDASGAPARERTWRDGRLVSQREL